MLKALSFQKSDGHIVEARDALSSEFHMVDRVPLSTCPARAGLPCFALARLRLPCFPGRVIKAVSPSNFPEPVSFPVSFGVFTGQPRTEIVTKPHSG